MPSLPMLLTELTNEDPSALWHMRFLVYTSPNGLVTHPDTIIYHVLEVGRAHDVLWARKEIKRLAGY